MALGFGDCGRCASHSFWPVGRGLARQLWSLIGLPKVRIRGRCGHVAQGRVCVVDAAVVGLVVPVLLEVDIMLGQGVAAVALLRGYAMQGGRARSCTPVHSWKSEGPGDPVVSAFAEPFKLLFHPWKPRRRAVVSGQKHGDQACPKCAGWRATSPKGAHMGLKPRCAHGFAGSGRSGDVLVAKSICCDCSVRMWLVRVKTRQEAVFTSEGSQRTVEERPVAADGS